MRIVIADDDMLVSGALRTILEKDQDIEVQGYCLKWEGSYRTLPEI